MISWQQLESDRLLCKHEQLLHRTYIKENENQFNNEFTKNREQEGWTNYTSILEKNKISRDEDLFNDQTYLHSNDYLCHVYELVKAKKT